MRKRCGKVWDGSGASGKHCSSKGKSKRDELRGLNNLLKDQRFAFVNANCSNSSESSRTIFLFSYQTPLYSSNIFPFFFFSSSHTQFLPGGLNKNNEAWKATINSGLNILLKLLARIEKIDFHPPFVQRWTRWLPLGQVEISSLARKRGRG